MRTFEYKGYSETGRSLRGLVQAYDIKDAREKLAQQGVLVHEVNAAGDATPWSRRRRRVFDLDARAAFYHELAAVLKAGIPLSPALALLVDSPEMGESRPVIAGIRDAIQEGQSLALALADAGNAVSAFETAIVHSGERAGHLGDALMRLAGYTDEQRRVRDRLLSALLYPVIILLLSVVVGFVMLFVLLPSFRDLLAEGGMELPQITRWVLGGARVAGWLAPVALVASVAATVWARRRWRRDATFRVRVDRRLHQLPFLSTFLGVLVNLRFARTLSTLLSSGVPLIESLTQTAHALGSPWVEERLIREIDTLRQGKALSEVLSRVPPLDQTLPGWLRAGEASGDVPTMLETAANRAQDEWDRRVTRSMTLVESLLIALVGLFVFLLAVSILLPILSLNQSLQ